MKFFYTICFLLASITLSAQIGEVISIGANLAEKINDANNRSRVSKYLKYDTLDNVVIVKSRIPVNKIKGRIQGDVISTQKKLEQIYLGIKRDSFVDFQGIDYSIKQLKVIDVLWDISYYLEEVENYKKIQPVRKQKKEEYLQDQQRLFDIREKIQSRYKDSINLIENQKYLIVKKQKDSIDLIESQKYSRKIDSINTRAYQIRLVRVKAEEQKKDSIEIYERTKKYHFVTIDDLGFYDKPNGKKVGKLSIGSYVTIDMDANNKGEYIKIDACDYEGYILKKYLVKYIDDLPKSVDKEQLKKYYFCGYETVIKTTNYMPSGTIISSRTRYYTGPRGGCFYYSSSGSKVYVDRSYCN